jgi:hypothetical protein
VINKERKVQGGERVKNKRGKEKGDDVLDVVM